jgi:hypothetical protein
MAAILGLSEERLDSMIRSMGVPGLKETRHT